MKMKQNIAVCVHVYYADMWNYIMEYIKNIPGSADYYITCHDAIYPLISERAARDLVGAEVLIAPNTGMDALPFLIAAREKQLFRYKAVLKLHTKNQKSELRTNQGRIMLDGLCGSTTLVENIVEVFRQDPDAGMVGTAFQLRSANALMYGNRDRMRSLLSSLRIDITDWPFFTGTMFWIAGRMLRDIVEITPQLLDEALGEEASSTGADGALAHTIERAFGALIKSMAANLYVTEKKGADSPDFLVLPLRQHGPANHWRFLELGSTDLAKRHIEAKHWCQLIMKSEYFDKDYYRKEASPYAVPGMDDVYHFVLYGDLFELNPSRTFSTTYYQILRRDVVRESMCSLAHYLQSGRHENSSANPSREEWEELSKRHLLFDAEWYQARYSDVTCSGIEPERHYRLIGQWLGRIPSPKFRLSEIPVIDSEEITPVRAFERFFKKHYLEESLLYGVLKRATHNGDYNIIPSLAKRIVCKFGTSRALNEALATSYTLDGQWNDAEKKWLEFWREATRAEDSSRHGASVLHFDRPSKPLPAFESIEIANIYAQKIDEGNHGNTAPRARVCIYTSLFGSIDDLIPVIEPAEGVDYICFTDYERNAKGWQQIIVDQPDQPSDNLNAKIFKILPHKFLSNYEYSLFVDANTVFLGRTKQLLDICRYGGDFVMWQHPFRDDVYTEVCAVIAHRRHSPANIIKQLQHYSKSGLPRNTAMFEASFIWRRHNDPCVSTLMEEWWQHICKFSSRDQISLAYLVWKNETRPTLMPRELGTSRDNVFFFKTNHRNGATRKAEESNPLRTASTQHSKARNITFLYHEKYASSGSTVLRGQQLSRLIARHYEGDRAVRYINEPIGIRNEIIILTKGYLKMTTPDQLHALRRHNILIADFVDEPPRQELIGHLDMLMASSLCGYKEYLMSFSDVPSFHVTHHVDTRIPRCEEAATNTFRAGYFGEIVNTIRCEEIDKLVEFNLVDTSKQTSAWIDELVHYNFHYAFRNTRSIDGAKPFLKGFVAAHCGSNMIIQKSAGDASFYLGTDYPYLVENDANHQQIVETLEYARDTIGGREWRYGREIMREVQARSSLEYVTNEFDAMIKVL